MHDDFIDKESLNRNKNINRGFRALRIWQDAVNIYCFVHKVMSMHSEVHFKVKAQIEDSALSVSSNIAEGYSRRTVKENLRFNEIALSSLSENYSQMFALRCAEQLTKEEFSNYDDLSYKLENELISMNKKLIQKINSDTSWHTNYE